MEACFATELHRVLGSWTAEVLLCLLGYMTRMKVAFGVTFQEVGVSLWGEADSRISSMSTELLVNADSNLVVVARLQPTSLQTVSAIASMYDDTFPEALQGMGTSTFPDRTARSYSSHLLLVLMVAIKCPRRSSSIASI